MATKSKADTVGDDILEMAADAACLLIPQEEADPKRIEDLTETVASWFAMLDDIEVKEIELKELKKQCEVLRMVTIPTMMKNARIASDNNKGTFRMPDGSGVCLKPDLFVSVKAANRDQAKVYLNANGYGDCVKEEFSTTNLKAMIKALRTSGVDPDKEILAADGEPLFKQYYVIQATPMDRKIE